MVLPYFVAIKLPCVFFPCHFHCEMFRKGRYSASGWVCITFHFQDVLRKGKQIKLLFSSQAVFYQKWSGIMCGKVPVYVHYGREDKYWITSALPFQSSRDNWLGFWKHYSDLHIISWAILHHRGVTLRAEVLSVQSASKTASGNFSVPHWDFSVSHSRGKIFAFLFYLCQLVSAKGYLCWTCHKVKHLSNSHAFG